MPAAGMRRVDERVTRRVAGKVAGLLVGGLAAIAALLIAVAPASAQDDAPVIQQAGFETGDFSLFDRTSTASGSLALDSTRAYGGDYSALAAHAGGGPGFAFTRFDVDWGEGDNAWYGAAFYLPATFDTRLQTDAIVVSWGNRVPATGSNDYSGILIAGSNRRAYLVRGDADSREVLAGPIDLPRGKWFFLEVHQRLGESDALNEVFVDGALTMSSTAPNYYGRRAKFVRYGIHGLSQLLPLELWFDRVVARKSGSNGDCSWDVSATPGLANGRYTAVTKHDGGWPVGCWRPYSEQSPFNQRIPADARLDPRSSEMVSRLTGAGVPPRRSVGHADTPDDFHKPTYWASPTDPLVRLEASSISPIDGELINVPAGARPAGGGDGHMTIVQPTGWEYDLYAAEPVTGGVLRYNSGRRIPVDGDGLNSAATSARFGNLAGRVRAQEMEEGRINHALFMSASTIATTSVYPAAKSDGNSDPALGYPPMGTRFQLVISDAELARFPPWKQTLLRALRDYGGYLGDSTSAPWTLASFESGSTYTSFGVEDRMVAFVREALQEGQGGITRSGDLYYLDVASGVDWANRLRVIDPCVTQRTC